jgi:hypothetical protein
MNKTEYQVILDCVFSEEMERRQEFSRFKNDPERLVIADDKPWILHKEPIPSMKQLLQAIQQAGLDVETVVRISLENENGEGDEEEQEGIIDTIRQIISF